MMERPIRKSGAPIYYEENYENANEESAIKSILEMAVRRCMDALQQRF